MLVFVVGNAGPTVATDVHVTLVPPLVDIVPEGRRGRPISFTPHDFRRLFTTEMVSSGLPLHIAATLLGHLNLDTTRGYTAVFPEDVIAAHQHFIERRRTLGPLRELQTASGEEWQEFENHFLLRKVALGDCHRPYGTPCVHEHASLPGAGSCGWTLPRCPESMR